MNPSAAIVSTAAILAVACVAVLAALALAWHGATWTPVPGHPAPAYATCTEEDGSTPGQRFPCLWDATRQGNGRGESFVIRDGLAR